MSSFTLTIYPVGDRPRLRAAVEKHGAKKIAERAQVRRDAVERAASGGILRLGSVQAISQALEGLTTSASR
jgi:hypothetical protein